VRAAWGKVIGRAHAADHAAAARRLAVTVALGGVLVASVLVLAPGNYPLRPQSNASLQAAFVAIWVGVIAYVCVGRALFRRFARLYLSWFVRAVILYRSPRSVTRAVVQTIAAVAIVLAVTPQWFSVERSTAAKDDAAFELLDAAINRAVCNGEVDRTASIRIAEEAVSRDVQLTPIRSVIISKAGSLSAFCHSGAESSTAGPGVLLPIETLILRLRSRISAAGLAKALHFVRLAGVLGFVLLLMSVGYSAAFGLGMAFAGFWLLANLKNQLYSVSSFQALFILQAAALYALAAGHRWARTTIGRGAVGAGAGIWAAVTGSDVPGTVPVQIAMLLVVACDAMFVSEMRAWAGRVRQSAALILGFAAGYVLLRASSLPGARVVTAGAMSAPPPLLDVLPSGPVVLGVGLVFTMSSIMWLARSRSRGALVAALLGTASCVSSLVLGNGALSGSGNQSYQMFFGAFALLCVCQGALNAAWELVDRTAAPLA